MEIIEILIAFIALVAAWRCWKKTARAAVRDRLFDLRDELRNHYVAAGLDMNDGVYEVIRGRINKLLLYTKGMRMIGYLYFSTHIDDNQVQAESEELEHNISKCDRNTEELIRRIRHQACETVLIYMAATSLGFISAAVIMLIYMLPTKIVHSIKRCIRSFIEIKPATLEYAALY